MSVGETGKECSNCETRMDIRTTLEDAEIAEVGGEDQATASDRAAFPPATRCLRFAGLWHGSSRSGLATMRESVPRAEASGGIPAPARATFGCDRAGRDPLPKAARAEGPPRSRPC